MALGGCGPRFPWTICSIPSSLGLSILKVQCAIFNVADIARAHDWHIALVSWHCICFSKVGGFLFAPSLPKTSERWIFDVFWVQRPTQFRCLEAFAGCKLAEKGVFIGRHTQLKKSTLNTNNTGSEKVVFPMSSLGMLGYSMGEHLRDVNKKQPH